MRAVMFTLPLARWSFCLALALVLAACTAATSSAQVPSRGYAKEGAYVGAAGLVNFTLDGVTFDGVTYYQEEGGDEIAILPQLDRRNPIRAVLGFRARQAALEFSYERAAHNGDFLGFDVPATYQAINVDARLFFLTRGRVQPHVLAGLAFPWLTVEDGSAASIDPDAALADARWRGQGLNLEAGITFLLHPRLGVSAGYTYRVLWFNRVQGVSDTTFDLRPRFRETGSSPVVMGFFTF
jgi:opacity protein-like surface antigen